MAADEEALRAKFQDAQQSLKTAREQSASADRSLREILPTVTNPQARGRINQQLWEMRHLRGVGQGCFSQAGQDWFLDTQIFKRKLGGQFVEIGGYDGITGSNCLFFELLRGWSGILIEPSPTYFAKAAAFRRAECLQIAIADQTGEAEFLDIRAGLTQMSGLTASYDAALRAQVEDDPRHQGELIRVEARTLPDILDERGLVEIDYVSLDVEGGEMAILSAFPFEHYQIQAWTIENNSGDSAIPELMKAQGYRLVEVLGVDGVYVRTEQPA